MKKFLVSMLIVSGSMLFAADKPVECKSNYIDTNKIKDPEMRSFLCGLESVETLSPTSPSSLKVTRDFYEAKTCSKDFYNKVSIKELQEWMATSTQFIYLIALDKQIESKYNETINTYGFLNCGYEKK